MFHSGRSCLLRPSDSPRNGFVAGAHVCLSTVRNGSRQTSATPPVKPTHDWHEVHNRLLNPRAIEDLPGWQDGFALTRAAALSLCSKNGFRVVPVAMSRAW